MKITALALLALPLLLAATPASAQDANATFRVLMPTDGSLLFVSTTVTGPRTARRLTEIIAFHRPLRTGSTSLIADIIVNCDAGTVITGDILSYKGEVPGPRNPAPTPPDTVTPAEQTGAWWMMRYACANALPDSADAQRFDGAFAAFAFARSQSPG